MRSGAAMTGRRTERSDVKLHMSGSVSTRIPATASTRKTTALIRRAPCAIVAGSDRTSPTMMPSRISALVPSRVGIDHAKRADSSLMPMSVTG